jgi:hypothetical protein
VSTGQGGQEAGPGGALRRDAAGKCEVRGSSLSTRPSSGSATCRATRCLTFASMHTTAACQPASLALCQTLYVAGGCGVRASREVKACL